MITFHFKPHASLLGAIIAVLVAVLLVSIFPSLKQTWVLEPFWGGLCALGIMAAAVSAFSAMVIFNNLSRVTTEVAGVIAGYVISFLYLRSDFSLLGWLLGTIAYGFAAYFVYHFCCDAVGKSPD